MFSVPQTGTPAETPGAFLPGPQWRGGSAPGPGKRVCSPRQGVRAVPSLHCCLGGWPGTSRGSRRPPGPVPGTRSCLQLGLARSAHSRQSRLLEKHREPHFLTDLLGFAGSQFSLSEVLVRAEPASRALTFHRRRRVPSPATKAPPRQGRGGLVFRSEHSRGDRSPSLSRLQTSFAPGSSAESSSEPSPSRTHLRRFWKIAAGGQERPLCVWSLPGRGSLLLLPGFSEK